MTEKPECTLTVHEDFEGIRNNAKGQKIRF